MSPQNIVFRAFQASIQQRHWMFAEMEGRSSGQINSALATTTLRQSLLGMPLVIKKPYPYLHSMKRTWGSMSGRVAGLRVSLRRNAPFHLDSPILTAPSLIGFSYAWWSYVNSIKDKVIRKEETSIEKMLPYDWVIGKLVGHFLN